MNRRELLRLTSWGLIAGGGVLGIKIVGGALASPSAADRRIILAGPLSGVPVGARRAVGRVIVMRDDRGVAAVSSRCTHLGCTVTANARGFECPCHGSAFAGDGRVLYGPATRPLPWYQVSLGDDGQLRIDLDSVVSAATRLEVDEPA